MTYYTLSHIALETGMPEDKLRFFSTAGIFYADKFNELVRISEHEYTKLRKFITYWSEEL
jgi:hypothetical protein